TPKRRIAPGRRSASRSTRGGDPMPAAFEGVKVVDTAINYAGPTISTYLADQGAEVIHVERRIVGDASRRSGNTPFLKLNSRHYMAINRGKRSITLDITKPEGQERSEEHTS